MYTKRPNVKQFNTFGRVFVKVFYSGTPKPGWAFVAYSCYIQ